MDNHELHCMLKNLIGEGFDRVFSRQEKINIKNNKYYVFNTEIWPKTGHFIAIYSCGLNIYVFDSIGLNQFTISDIKCENKVRIVYLNSKKLQSQYSQICSLYCIFFIYNIFHGKSYSYIVNHFSTNSDNNDTILYSWYIKNKFFKNYKKLNIIDTKYIEQTVRNICQL